MLFVGGRRKPEDDSAAASIVRSYADGKIKRELFEKDIQVRTAKTSETL